MNIEFISTAPLCGSRLLRTCIAPSIRGLLPHPLVGGRGVTNAAPYIETLWQNHASPLWVPPGKHDWGEPQRQKPGPVKPWGYWNGRKLGQLWRVSIVCWESCYQRGNSEIFGNAIDKFKIQILHLPLSCHHHHIAILWRDQMSGGQMNGSLDKMQAELCQLGLGEMCLKHPKTLCLKGKTVGFCRSSPAIRRKNANIRGCNHRVHIHEIDPRRLFMPESPRVLHF